LFSNHQIWRIACQLAPGSGNRHGILAVRIPFPRRDTSTDEEEVADDDDVTGFIRRRSPTHVRVVS
jgi:hypothetical protein